ncbi:MAG: hypothetical protein ABIH28_01625 [archaeon]
MLGKKSDEYEGRLDDTFELNFNLNKNFIKLNLNKNFIKLIGLILILLFFFSYFNSFFGIFEKDTCGDETPYGKCSSILPYFCLKGTLVQDASFCGCPDNITIKGDFCEYEYQIAPKTISLDYVLNGKYEKIDFLVYKGMESYLEKKPQTFFYSNGKNYSLYDFKQRVINEQEQRKLLLPLVIEIQNIAKNKEDQARIAISLVQNIPYEDNPVFDQRNPFLWNLKYPYDVLYQNEGLCGSKSDLLAFLLKEIGYEVVIFHYYLENHEAVGIRCPIKYSLNNMGYCFVEATQPAIISYSEGDYSEQGKLTSVPEIIHISDGISLGGILEEYNDAKDFGRIYRASEKNDGNINLMEYFRYKQLIKKYGLPN